MSFSDSDFTKSPLVAIENEILLFWKKEKCFDKSLAERCGAPLFSTYDGPPFATGLPHYGHIIAGTIKDVVPRYKTMQGFYVPRRFGWDCHGLPIEYEIEKELKLAGPQGIEALGLKQFNQECRNIVLRYSAEWRERVERMGRWVDFSQTFHTMDLSFMESVWWVFKELYNKDLVYEGHKVMPFSTALGTPLSNFEASSHYQELKDPSITVRFPLLDRSLEILAWTTTPWTLPSNLALMVNPQATFAIVLSEGVRYALIAERVATLFKDRPHEIVGHFLGKELIGKRYKPPFDYFKDHSNAFQVIEEPLISAEEGTGVVHCAPAFGELDFYACKRAGIELVCPVDRMGRFTDEIPEFTGVPVREANARLIALLKEKRDLFSAESITHRVPFCWRSDTPLIYRAVSTWFIAVEKIKTSILDANAQIEWVPEHLRDGRFGKWLESARDWAVSRNRYWGTPIPIWRSPSGKIHVVGSIKELETLTGQKIHDLHRDQIDDLTFTREKEQFQRISQVFDCWFESGSMPYAQNHYPFEGRPLQGFPADFIAEGLDQTRGWFYTLTVLAAALYDKPAFKHVIVNGIVLAEDGNKMSKRLKNYPEPMDVIEQYGADALRLYLLQSPAVKAEDLRFSKKGVEQQLKQTLLPLWNALTFFETYAKIYHWTPSNHPEPPTNLIDRWILAQLNVTLSRVESAMERYHLHEAVQELPLFVDALTNWYIRCGRERFWQDEETLDRHSAFATLHHILLSFAKIAAPFIPFTTEALFQKLRRPSDPISIHLCDYPKVTSEHTDPLLATQMVVVRHAVSLGHFLRKEHQLKVRQPLRSLLICASEEQLKQLQPHSELIKQELNVKELCYSKEDSFVRVSAKPNFRTLGKKIGAKMPLAQKAIEKLSKEQLSVLEQGESVTLQLAPGETFLLNPEEITLQREIEKGVVATHEGGMTVALNTEIDESLLLEGIAREFKNRVNQMRKEAKLKVTDRIQLSVDASEQVQKAIEAHRKDLLHDLLALSCVFKECKGTACELNGEPITIQLVPVAQ